jgi:hypothetical protein
MRRNVTLPIYARRYARVANGTKLDPKYREILGAAADGREVDLLDLNLATHAGMVSACTRAPTSPMRRAMAADIFDLALFIHELMEGRDPTPRRPVRQPVQFEPDELENWLAT